MQLSRFERRWYVKDITTDPPVAGVWAATFDDGSTWMAATTGISGWGADSYGWLVAGPDCDATDPDGITVIHLTDDAHPLARAVDNPEIPVIQLDGIYLY